MKVQTPYRAWLNWFHVALASGLRCLHHFLLNSDYPADSKYKDQCCHELHAALMQVQTMHAAWGLANTHMVEAFRNAMVWAQTLLEPTPSSQVLLETSLRALENSSCSNYSYVNLI